MNETTKQPESVERSAEAPFAARNGSAIDAVTEMALCEVPHIFLRPGQLYRFVVMPGCKACEDAASPHSPNESSSATAADNAGGAQDR